MSDKTNINSAVVDMYNPLIIAAKPILALSNAMNNTTSSLSTEQLLHKLSNLLNDFEECAENNRASFDSIKAAKYCLCTFVDEAAVRSGWANEEWAKNSLLVKAFDETWGGERFFEILETSKQDVDKNLYLIELIYLCIEFGYKGKYHVVKEGNLGIEKEKSALLNIIQKNRPNLYDSLFIQAVDLDEDSGQKSKISIPLWVIAILCALCIALLYTILQWSLGRQFDEVSSRVNALTLPKITTNNIQQVPKTNTTKLAPLLSSMIDKQYITVDDYPDKSVITILGDGLYEPGSEIIKDEYYSVFAAIGQELNNTTGKIVISGYTDNTPIRSMDYPSNWHLSQARADSVKKMLVSTEEEYIDDERRVRSEGMGETNPVAPNDTAENKAKNRRVEITLYHAGGPIVIKPASQDLVEVSLDEVESE